MSGATKGTRVAEFLLTFALVLISVSLVTAARFRLR
jgi:hypothetical protein